MEPGGPVDLADNALIDAAFMASGSPHGAEAVAQHAAMFGEAYTAALASGPEPHAAPLVVMAASGLVGMAAKA